MPNDIWSKVTFPKSSKKVHTVTVDGMTIEVDLQTKLEVQRFGEKYWTLKDGKLMRKPRVVSTGIKYAQWKDTENGHGCIDGHMFWPGIRSGNGKGFVYE